MVRESLAHAAAGTLRQANGIKQVPAEHYYDRKRWQRECASLFGRLPLVLATSSEIRKPGTYKALTVMGKPVLVCRNTAGEIRAFENSCAHRGSQVVLDGCGQGTRFVCPYHAWSYDTEGALQHVLNESDFGEVKRANNGLIALPVLERAGLIWVHLNPASKLDIGQFLCGYDEVLHFFNFDNWHFFDRRTVRGPNWKIAYDGYLDFYHLPILHKASFGTDISNQALYFQWGPHQRVSSPQTVQGLVGDTAEAEWSMDALLAGVWTIFPHVSIASFVGVGAVEEDSYQGVLLSQLFPGDEPGESLTVQNFLVDRELSQSQQAAATAQFEFLKGVVQDEDYATGMRQQQALRTGSRKHVLFGRNEEGGQIFHSWVDAILQADDAELASMFC